MFYTGYLLLYQHDDVEDMCDEIAEILEHDANVSQMPS
jgi:hypothetical protein